MIIPEGTRLKLDPKDDLQHTPEDVPNYNESMYYHFFDTKTRLGGWVRIGNRVHEGHAEVTCCLYLPDGRVGFMYNKPRISSNEQMNAGGMSFEVLEPFKRIRVRFDGDILLMADPYQMINPGLAFKSNPRVPCSIDMDVTGVSPMHGGEIVNLDGTPWELDPTTSVFRGHIEQHIAAKGHITIDGARTEVDGFGFRDKSWGPRYWNNFFWYKWLIVTFGPDFGLMVSYMGRPDDTPFLTSHVYENGVLHKVHEFRVENDWDENYYPKSLVAWLRTDKKEYRLEGKTLSLVPLRHLRTLPNGEQTNARITESMMEYRCEGHTGYGMAEYLDLMVDGKPISLTL